MGKEKKGTTGDQLVYGGRLAEGIASLENTAREQKPKENRENEKKAL